MVYLYTGSEQGIGVALVEALAAGCIRLSPAGVGAADIIQASKVGFLYSTVEDAVRKIRIILETEHSEAEVYDIAKRAQSFSPHVFEEKVRMVVERALGAFPQNRR